MASHIEMERIRKDINEVRRIAWSILKSEQASIDDYEIDFLESMTRWRADITLRQCEFLLHIRDQNEFVSEYMNFSVSSLLAKCALARDDLGERDAEFIVKLHESGATSLRRRDFWRLLRCSCDLGLVERYMLRR